MIHTRSTQTLLATPNARLITNVHEHKKPLMKFQIDFKTTLPHVAMTTAYDVDKDRATNVEMDTSIAIDPNHHSGGWYETYDLESGGDRFYAGGILEVYWDDNGEVRLTGYDGCFELPEFITDALESKGVIIDL